MTWMAHLIAGVVFAQNLPANSSSEFDIISDRPNIPSTSIASESGPGAIWVNPANIAYDRDPRHAVFIRTSPASGLTSVGAVMGIGGSSLGFNNHQNFTGGRDWSVDYSASATTPGQLSLGITTRFHLIDEGTNFATYDLGASWRPTPWFGLAAVTKNIKSKNPQGMSVPETGLGLAFRPFNDFAVAGFDFHKVYRLESSEIWNGTLRLRPMSGVYLRGSVAGSLSEPGDLNYGIGVELFVGGTGIGVHTGGSELLNGLTTWISSSERDDSIVRPPAKIAKLTLNEALPETPKLPTIFSVSRRSWLQTLNGLRQVADEKHYKGAVLVFDGSPLSPARARELRTQLLHLKEKGKPTLAYLRQSPSTWDYFVASAADQVLMHPATTLNLTGLAFTITNYRQLFDYIGVEPEFARRSDYKSRVESFTASEPSGPTLEMMNALADELFDVLISEIANQRGGSEEQVDKWIDQGPWTTQEAIEAGLIDGSAYFDQLDDALNKLIGSFSVEELPQNMLSDSPWLTSHKIATVQIGGAIVPGETPGGGLFSFGPSATGSRTVVRALEQASQDPTVKAIVLRVDSPGGSSFASDEIARTIDRIRENGMPVVTSMGGVAASGGYYVASGSDAIWAQPNTITGSIGVYAGKFSTATLYENLGIHTTAIERGQSATMFSGSQPWSAHQRGRMEAIVDDIYRQFKERVASGRDMEMNAVEKVAQGRVWSGRQAQELGLVDQLGGFEEAVVDAKRRAGLKDSDKVQISYFSGQKNGLDQWIGIQTKLQTSIRLPEELGTLVVPLQYPKEQIWMLSPWMLEASPQ